MTVQNPAVFLQAGSHPAEDVRRMIGALVPRPGVVYSTDLAVTEKSGTPNMSVDVAGGRAFIAGSEATYQGTYFVENRGVTNLVISAADPTNPRKDLIVAKVQDAGYSGATNAWSLAVVTGTAAASPSEPSVPANCLVLAMVDVLAAATSITNARITDRRHSTSGQSRATALGGEVICLSTNRPASPHEGLTIYETDTDRVYKYDGSSWRFISGKVPFVHATRTTAQSVANATITAISFNATDVADTDSMHDPAGANPSRITVPFAGLWRFSYVGTFVANATGERAFWLGKNGVSSLTRYAWANGIHAGSNAFIAPGSVDIPMAANDYVELYCFQSSGGALNAGGAGIAGDLYLQASFVGWA